MRARSIALRLALIVGVLGMALPFFGASDRVATHASSPIQHIVFIIKENHSFDSYFGLFPGANGTTAGKVKNKGVVTTIQLDSAPDQPINFCHEWPCAQRDYDNGAMDAFNTSDPKCAMPPYPCYIEADQSLIPNYWQLAQHFELNDSTFASLMGPSFPNHLYTVAAASGPDTNHSAIGSPKNPPGTHKYYGCDAATATTVELYNKTNVFPCFSFSTLADEMTTAGVSWKYYAPIAGESGYNWSAMDAFSQDRSLPNVTRWTNFDTDVAKGSLPAFSWLVPPANYSEHPPNSTCQGENWTVDKIDAIENSSLWSSTVIILAWDDYGGLYDHLAPQQVDPLGFGFRVPMLIISPFAYATDNPGNPHVSHSSLEFSSVLKLAEEVYNLPSLGRRDVTAGDLMADLDTSRVHDTPLILQQRTCPSIKMQTSQTDEDDPS